MAGVFIDEEPEERVAKIELSGSDPGYLLEIAPDPTDAEVIRGGLMELTGRTAADRTPGHG